jgi:integrase
MKKYLKKSDIIGSDKYIFHNKRGTCLKPRDAERLLKQYVDNGIYDKKIDKAFTFQDLRHAAIKYMLMGNASNDEVAAYCGITTKWLPRYQRVVADGNAITSADYSVISINMDGTSSQNS